MNKRLFLCLLCGYRIALLFLHTEEEPADIHIQLDDQVIVAVNVNAFEYRVDDHLFLLDGGAVRNRTEPYWIRSLKTVPAFRFLADRRKKTFSENT